MQRLFIIYNPRSSRYKDVRAEVLDRLKTLRGYTIGKAEIIKAGFEENVQRLSQLFQDGDTVIAAGGDATAAITVNAILKTQKDVTFAALPYGNFNDLARTLNLKKFQDVFAPNATPQKLYPFEIYVDGKFWRYATCYVTMGMTAEACEIFDDQKIRKNLQKGHKSSWRSYLHLVKWYFKNRHSKIFVPELKLNGKLYTGRISDYAALSGNSMCRVMKGRGDFKKTAVFLSRVCYLISLPRLTKLMLQSIFHCFPGHETTGDLIEFVNPATVELQAEGEYHIFKHVKKVEIKKSVQHLKVIQGANHGK